VVPTTSARPTFFFSSLSCSKHIISVAVLAWVELAWRMHHTINNLLLLLLLVLQVVSSSSIAMSPTLPPRKCQSSLHSSRHALQMASSQQHQKLVHSRHWGPNSKKGSSKKKHYMCWYWQDLWR
jgi:hypothetical protein